MTFFHVSRNYTAYSLLFLYSVEDDVLYAVFVKGSNLEETIPSSKSAICAYSMAMVEKIFLSNIELCFRGETNKVNSLAFLIPKSFLRLQAIEVIS